jgi:hypothetical protein
MTWFGNSIETPGGPHVSAGNRSSAPLGAAQVDVGRSEKVNARENRRRAMSSQPFLVTREGEPASFRLVGTISAQEPERGIRTAVTKNSRNLNRVVGGYDAKLRV